MALVYKCDFCGKSSDSAVITGNINHEKNLFFIETNDSCICAECVELVTSTEDYQKWGALRKQSPEALKE